MTPFKDQILARLERYFGVAPLVVPISPELEFAIVKGDDVGVTYNAVFTLGMSAHIMEGVPDPDWRYAELVLLLPTDWPLELSSSNGAVELSPSIGTVELAPSNRPEKIPPSNWPLVWLERLAMFPRRQNSWLGLAHSIPNGIPAQPFDETTQFAAWLLIPPVELAKEFARFRLETGEVINFWTPIPIYADELALKTNKGATELINKFARAGIGDIFDPNRVSIYQRKTNIFGKYKD